MTTFSDDFVERYTGDTAERFLRTNVSRDIFELSYPEYSQLVRSIGVSLSNERLRDIRREMLGIDFHERDVRSLDDSDIMRDSWFYDRHGLQLSQDYQYHFEVDLINKRTGETLFGVTRSLSTSQTLTIGELKGEMRSQLETPVTDTEWLVTRIEMKGAFAMIGVIKK